MNCPICGHKMFLMRGYGWVYDLWVCPVRGDDLRLCEGEIELDVSTYPEEK